MQNKVVTLKEAVSKVQDGDHIVFSGFTISRCPMAFVFELIRQGKKNLTLSQSIAGMDTDLLVGSGAVKKLIYGGGSLDRFGPIHMINRSIEERKLEVEECSGLSIEFRYLAGSLNIPFIPIKSLMGSDILNQLLSSGNPSYKIIDNPFNFNEAVLTMQPLIPDLAVIHVHEADTSGNTYIKGPRWDETAAFAAKKIIITTEEIVPLEQSKQNPSSVTLPAFRVDAVVHVPFGAHPTAVYKFYDYDKDIIIDYVRHSASESGFQSYLDKYVFGVKGHNEYLNLVGDNHYFTKLKADPKLGY